MSLFNSSPDSDEIVQKQEAEHRIGWYDATLDAASWWSLDRITPLQAATLMCEFNPDDDANNPELVTTSETGPNDFKRLLREFNSVAEADAKPRTLAQWHDVAHDRGLKHHSWIDAYKTEKLLIGTDSATDCIETPPAQEQANRKQKRKDALALELEEILGEMGLGVTTGAVMEKLKKDAGKGGCVIDVAADGSGIVWERSGGMPETLHLDALDARLRRMRNRC